MSPLIHDPATQPCTLTLLLHFPDDDTRQTWIERNRDVLEAENAKYATDDDELN